MSSDSLTPAAARILPGQTGLEDDCQIRGGVHTPLDAPWRGEQREADKTRLFKYVRRESDGAPFAKVVADVFGQDAVETAGADYNLARRFFDRHSVFKIGRRGGRLWVQPTLAAFNLSQQYANRKTSGRRRDGLSNGESGSKTGVGSREGDCQTSNAGATARRSSTGTDDWAASRTDCRPAEPGTTSEVWRAQYPRDRAESVLSKRLVLDGSNGAHDYRAELLRELGTERAIQSDKFKILRRVRGTGEDYLLIPYRTRFNSGDRAASVREGFDHALTTAAGRHTDAVVLTLTTDSKRFDSLSAAMDGLTDAKGRFMSWLASDYQLGHRPENLTALEFTESGLPHLHVVLFGVSWAAPQSVLAAKWDDLEQGSVVDVRSAKSRGGSSRWQLHNDDGATVALRQYLGKAIDGLEDLAGMDAEAVRETAEAGDINLWRQALYWATGRQYYSCSRILKDTGDGLPFVRRYEFVGVAQYSDIPAHVRDNARVFVDRGAPPD